MFHGGETVVAAVSYRDYVLVFGSYGTVVRVWLDVQTGNFTCSRELEI